MIRVASVFLVQLCAASVFAVDRPHIVMIMADDPGYECIGANGSEMYSTPNLDRLEDSAEGLAAERLRNLKKAMKKHRAVTEAADSIQEKKRGGMRRASQDRAKKMQKEKKAG